MAPGQNRRKRARRSPRPTHDEAFAAWSDGIRARTGRSAQATPPPRRRHSRRSPLFGHVPALPVHRATSSRITPRAARLSDFASAFDARYHTSPGLRLQVGARARARIALHVRQVRSRGDEASGLPVYGISARPHRQASAGPPPGNERRAPARHQAHRVGLASTARFVAPACCVPASPTAPARHRAAAR